MLLKNYVFLDTLIHDLRPINLINQKIIETAEFGINIIGNLIMMNH